MIAAGQCRPDKFLSKGRTNSSVVLLFEGVLMPVFLLLLVAAVPCIMFGRCQRYLDSEPSAAEPLPHLLPGYVKDQDPKLIESEIDQSVSGSF